KKNDNVLGDDSVEPGAKQYSIGTTNETTNLVNSSTPNELNTGLILFVNVVNVVPTSTNKNGSEQVGDESVMKEITTSYANKLSPMSLTKANLWKLDAIMPNDVNYDVWLPLASVHEVNDRIENSLYGYFIGKMLAFPVVEWFVHYNWEKYGLCNFGESLLKEDLSRVPLWRKFHDVPLVAYTSNGLSLIATKIGTPMMIAFGRHLEEIDTLQTQFGKKGDKIATLLEDIQEMAYSA
ncbi:hypothetical protein Tco_1279112, partial [Tanacetum coccineum]